MSRFFVVVAALALLLAAPLCAAQETVPVVLQGDVADVKLIEPEGGLEVQGVTLEPAGSSDITLRMQPDGLADGSEGSVDLTQVTDDSKLQSAIDEQAAQVSGNWDEAVSQLTGAKENLLQNLARERESWHDQLEETKDKLKDAAESVGEVVKDGVQEVVEGAKSAWETVKNWFGSIFG